MIKLIKSSFYNESVVKPKLVDFVAGAEIFSMGEQCVEFEKGFAAKQGRKYAVFVANGSAANLVLIQALLNLGRISRGDKAGFSALTWSTNVMPLIQLGLEPVAVDCALENLNVSEVPDVAVMFLTNVLGFCGDIVGMRRECEERGIILLEDNCESLGSRVDGKMLGNFSLASTFSFFVGHHLSTIEGGMICTDDDELAEMLRLVRAHGWDRNLTSETQEKLRKEHNVDDFFAKYTFYDLAYNVRPTEINGFLGNLALGYWDEIVQKRAANFARFAEAVRGNDDIYDLELGHMELISNFAMPLIFKSEELFEEYRGKFKDVEIRPIIAGSMTEQPFYKKYSDGSQSCANAEKIHRCGFYFGNNPDMDEGEIDTLCNLING